MKKDTYPGLTKAQVQQLEMTRWASANGWRPDPVGRPQLFSVNEEGVRIRIRFFERSVVLEHKIPLTEDEKKLSPNQNVHWVEICKRAYSRVSIQKGKLDWNTVQRKRKTTQKEED